MRHLILNFINDYGYLGTFFMVLLENIFPPIPSDIILPFSGFMTTYTKLTINGMIISATLGSIWGAIFLYWIGHMLSNKNDKFLVSKLGYVLNTSDIDKTTSWFNKYGYITILFCRMLPLIRSLISIPAGMANMNLPLFIIYTTLGTLIWNSLLIYTGAILGSSWNKILILIDTYSSIIYGVLIVLLLTYLFTLLKRKFLK